MTTLQHMTAAITEELATKIVTLETLGRFCSDEKKEPYRPQELYKPFSFANFTYATDGKYIVRVKRDPSVLEPQVPANRKMGFIPHQAAKLFKGFPRKKSDFKFVFLPVKKELNVKCVRMNGWYVDPEKLRTIIRYLPNVKFYWGKHKAEEAIHFIFDGGCGLLMPMRPHTPDNNGTAIPKISAVA